MSKTGTKKLVQSPIKSISLNCPKTSLVKFRSQKELPSKLKLIKFHTVKLSAPGPIYVKGTSSTDLFYQPKLNKTKSVFLLKDAVHNKEWLQRARENLIHELSVYLNASNSLAVELPPPLTQYKYYLGKGNNSSLIKQCLNLRPWWVQVEEDQLFNANFVWTQFKNTEFFRYLPKAYERLKSINHSLLGKSLVLNTLFEDFTFISKQVDISNLSYDLITKSKYFITFDPNYRIDPGTSKMQNKLQHNQHLSDKKYLYKNMKEYYTNKSKDVFDKLPLTFHIDTGSLDYIQFLNYAQQHPNTLWIVKPGENTNRGSGIFVTNKVSQILNEVKVALSPGSKHTFIIQKYIEKPFLINKRKFDIRLYTLVTSINRVFQAYFYNEGYLRTTSKAYNANDLENKFIHLTNDAIQNKCEDYGKFEGGNKLSYKDFQRYLDNKKFQINFIEQILPKIKKIVKDSIKATYNKLNSEHCSLNFEIFGYDFLLDQNLKPWLLEVNTNPCLELSSTNLARIIPAMLENAMKIVVDPLFPEPRGNLRKVTRIDSLPENKFELIFHQYFVE